MTRRSLSLSVVLVLPLAIAAFWLPACGSSSSSGEDASSTGSTGGSSGSKGGATGNGGATGSGGTTGTGGATSSGGATGKGGATGTGGATGVGGTTGAGGAKGSGGTIGSGGTGGNAATCPATVLTAGDHNEATTSGGESRTFIVHVPTGYTGNTRVPVVLDFHPLGGTGSSQEGSSGWKAQCDSVGCSGIQCGV